MKTAAQDAVVEVLQHEPSMSISCIKVIPLLFRGGIPTPLGLPLHSTLTPSRMLSQLLPILFPPLSPSLNNAETIESRQVRSPKSFGNTRLHLVGALGGSPGAPRLVEI